MKILHVVFSCNRIKYLTKSLESWENLDYGDHQVDRLLIDDYPRNRNEAIFDLLGKAHNFCFKLNDENLGLSVNWSQFFDWLKTTDYDYVQIGRASCRERVLIVTGVQTCALPIW